MKPAQITTALESILAKVTALPYEPEVSAILQTAISRMKRIEERHEEGDRAIARKRLKQDPVDREWLDAAKTLFGGVEEIAAVIDRAPKTVYGWFQGRPISDRHVTTIRKAL